MLSASFPTLADMVQQVPHLKTFGMLAQAGGVNLADPTFRGTAFIPEDSVGHACAHGERRTECVAATDCEPCMPMLQGYKLLLQALQMNDISQVLANQNLSKAIVQ